MNRVHITGCPMEADSRNETCDCSRMRAAAPRKVRLQSIMRDRRGWYAVVEREGDRAVGSLYHGAVVMRYCFNVKVDHANVFRVDIGTGSGVKVAFQFGRNVR